jgi:predicted RNase H-like HicB family nuclease
MQVTVTVHEEQGSFWSEVAELPGCFASGGTLEELGEALAESVGLYLWDRPARTPERVLAPGKSRIEIAPP